MAARPLRLAVFEVGQEARKCALTQAPRVNLTECRGRPGYDLEMVFAALRLIGEPYELFVVAPRYDFGTKVRSAFLQRNATDFV